MGGALQIALFVSSHHPFAEALPFQSEMGHAMFAIVVTQLARSKLGLMSAIGVHAATDAILWIGFGTHSRISLIFGPHALFGAVRMLPEADWPAFAVAATLIGFVWLKRRDLWDRPDSFRFRWNVLGQRARAEVLGGT